LILPVTSPTGGLSAADSQDMSDASGTILEGKTHIQLTTALSAPRTWTLAPAVSYLAGQMIVLSDSANSVTPANFITIARSGLDTIQGAATPLVLNQTGGAIVLASDGLSNFNVIHQPTVLASPILGVTGNALAGAGNIGEIVEGTVNSPGSALTTGTFLNVTSIALTAGAWDISGVIGFLPDTTTSITRLLGGTSTTTLTTAF